MKLFPVLLIALLTSLPGAGVAQSKTSPGATPASVTLEYSDDETQLVITDTQGNALVPSDGMVLPVGSVIRTLKTTAELQLHPNGSIVKLAPSTSFKVESLRDQDGSGTNDFALLGGKIRAVAAKLTGFSNAPGYNVRTPTANCGVRGTDFAMEYDPGQSADWVCVQEGQVDFTNITTGATVPVATNQIANTFDPTFQAAALEPGKVTALFSDVAFVKLNPYDVPGKLPPPVVAAQPTPPAQTTPPAEPTPVAPPAPEKSLAEGQDPLTQWLKNALRLQIGSLTINGTTYSEAALSPVFRADHFQMGLYLPVLSTNSLVDPSTWYHPQGNNEWSFGSDQTTWTAVVGDFFTDLALKIQFLEWGTQGVDPDYLKVGNLDSLTLGHGSVVRDLANNQDFPSVRKIGVSAGAQWGGFSAEGLVDDATNPSVVGGRVGFDLIGDQVRLGFQTVADLHLANAQDLALSPTLSPNPSTYGDPILLVGGVDLQFFHLNLGEPFRAAAYADVNTLAPYLRSATASSAQGFNPQTIWHDGGLGSIGGESGLQGNISVVDYRVAFQMDRGVYSNALFQGDYYRSRVAVLQNLVQYLGAPNDILTLAVLGSAGFTAFDVVRWEASYRLPMVLNPDGSVGTSNADVFKISLGVPRGKLPLVPLSGELSYERTSFVSSLQNGTNLFDANTVFRGEVAYAWTKSVELVAGLSTAVVRDGGGNVKYDATGKPLMGPTLTLETRLVF